ncbi:hypothetical protein HR060_11540 [Catenovulum sp. SM1970]|uniref:hypothetical protein n=1 Tax=Marinifaba aquimaris TaxID=2741323 RepID=UPI00157264F1|nr:hypothetical protein [Marinifaba aquimaris]NTS77495.1 hypothetical protein [Marinifaba aquimaris]
MELTNMELITAISSISAAISAVTAGIATYLAWRTISRNDSIKRAEIHTHFQGRIRAIQSEFTSGVNLRDKWEPTSKEKRAIRLYWYTVLDEWLVCCKEDKCFRPLWDDYYMPGIKGAMRNPHFVKDLETMFDGESGLLGYRLEFKEQINNIYRTVSDGRDLIWK